MTRRRLDTAAANDRTIRCHVCGEAHAVTAADSTGDRGEALDETEAVETAHYRLEVAARSAGPFALFNRRR